jgi:hypothetical protein
MTPKQLHDLFRTQIADTIEPYLFSSEEIYEYMTDAQRMLCRLTEGIPDATSSDVVRLEFGPGESFATMSPLVLTVRGAARESDGREVRVLNIEDFRFGLGAASIDTDYGQGLVRPFSGQLNSPTWRLRQGPQVNALILGMERNKARAFPIPTVNNAVIIEVYRLPRGTLSEQRSCTFEVDDQHHRHLLLWMKSLAFAKQDVDIRDEVQARNYEGQFYAYCEKVKSEQTRAKHKPRKVVYGGL